MTKEFKQNKCGEHIKLAIYQMYKIIISIHEVHTLLVCIQTCQRVLCTSASEVNKTYMSFHQLYLEWERIVTDCPQQVTVLRLGGHQKQGAWNKERPKYTAFYNHQMNLKYEFTYNSMYMLHGGFSIKLKHYCLQLIRKINVHVKSYS